MMRGLHRSAILAVAFLLLWAPSSISSTRTPFSEGVSATAAATPHPTSCNVTLRSNADATIYHSVIRCLGTAGGDKEVTSAAAALSINAYQSSTVKHVVKYTYNGKAIPVGG